MNDTTSIAFAKTGGITPEAWRDVRNELRSRGTRDSSTPNSSTQQLYIPYYDAYGNIFGYWDEQGNVVAEYTYDAFGNTVSQSGPLADFFRHRFSTKYFDPETGLYYYGYRYYSPVLMRWLTRDPIEEAGGVNLYAMCGNSLPFSFDDLGLWRMITGAYLVREDTAKRVEYKYAMQILLFIDELNKLCDQQGNRIYNAKIKDLVKTPFAEVRNDIQNNPDNVYLVAHCGLIYKGKNWEGRSFVWDESHVADEVVDINHDGSSQTLLDSFGSSLKIENVFGCYLMSGYRKIPIPGTSNQVSYKVSLDVLMPTFLSHLKAKYMRKNKASCVTDIIIYEGERNKGSAQKYGTEESYRYWLMKNPYNKEGARKWWLD